MKYIGVSLVFLLFLSGPVHAESNDAYSKAQLSAELLGPAVFGSLNGSYRINKNVALSLGFGYFKFSIYPETLTAWLIPAYASYLLGGDNSFFEMLAGGEFIAANSVTRYDTTVQRNFSGSGVLGLVGIGYRYWPIDGGFHFRATLYYLFGTGGGVPWPGLTFGYAF